MCAAISSFGHPALVQRLVGLHAAAAKSVDVVCAPTPATIAPAQSASASSVGFNDRALLIDGRPRFLTSGGFHYPRASPGSWRAIMRAVSRPKNSSIGFLLTMIWPVPRRRKTRAVEVLRRPVP